MNEGPQSPLGCPSQGLLKGDEVCGWFSESNEEREYRLQHLIPKGTGGGVEVIK